MTRKRSISKKRGRKGVKKRGGKRTKKSSNSKFLTALNRLKKLKKHERRQAMSMANDSFIRQFCSKVKSLKHAKVSAKTQKALRRHKKKLQKLMNTRTSISQKRAILSQRGGGKIDVFDVILAALPFVAAVL